jgi:hypothetical protein
MSTIVLNRRRSLAGRWRLRARLLTATLVVGIAAACSAPPTETAQPTPAATAPATAAVTESVGPTLSPTASASPTGAPTAAALPNEAVQELFFQSDQPLPFTIDEFHARYNDVAERQIEAESLANPDAPPDYEWLDREYGIAITGLAHPDGGPRMLTVSFLDGLRPAGEQAERDLFWSFAIRAFVEAASPALTSSQADRLVIELLGFTPSSFTAEALMEHWSVPRRNTIERSGVRYDLVTTEDRTHWIIVTAAD